MNYIDVKLEDYSKSQKNVEEILIEIQLFSTLFSRLAFILEKKSLRKGNTLVRITLFHGGRPCCLYSSV